MIVKVLAHLMFCNRTRHIGTHLFVKYLSRRYQFQLWLSGVRWSEARAEGIALVGEAVNEWAIETQSRIRQIAWRKELEGIEWAKR